MNDSELHLLQEPAKTLRKVPPRVVIENVRPEVNKGRFPVKRVAGEELEVTADIHCDGTDVLMAVLRYRLRGEASWKETEMISEPNDVWRGRFTPEAPGNYEYTLEAWVNNCADRGGAVAYGVLPLVVERERAQFGAWYEMFPRSAGNSLQRGTSLREAEARLPDIARMGFDVLYLPPVHPIGTSYRKGPNNSTETHPGDPGSPWAIGSPEGGHAAVHPELGTLADFDHFVDAARGRGLEVALDMAFQCSPDHPYVREHPEWFHHRPDGRVQCAENPPKKYEDIYPLNFESENWEALWEELKNVVMFWIRRGIRIFRVDNPHTKPYRFWEWLISGVRSEYPETIFLAEAFTRPKVMAYLAQCGFSQSYSYFTWRNTKREIEEYFTELYLTPVREFMRPNLFTNTPDILHEFLQRGGRPAFQIRLFLAATLGASYGIYGPAFELCEARAVPGTEEYQDSEKYQIRSWSTGESGNIKEWVTLVNRIRHENPALRCNHRLRFYPVSSDSLLCYSKTTPDLSNIVLVAVNLDPHHAHEGWVQLSLPELGLEPDHPYQVHDLLSDAWYSWRGPSNYVRLDPGVCPAHIFQLQRGLPGGAKP